MNHPPFCLFLVFDIRVNEGFVALSALHFYVGGSTSTNALPVALDSATLSLRQSILLWLVSDNLTRPCSVKLSIDA
jgi:hypothetical protein